MLLIRDYHMSTVALQGISAWSSIFARGPLGPRENMECRADMIGNAPVDMFKLFIICLIMFLYYIFMTFKKLRSIQVQIQKSWSEGTIQKASLSIYGVIILMTSCSESGPLWVHARVVMGVREGRLWGFNHEPYRPW